MLRRSRQYLPKILKRQVQMTAALSAIWWGGDILALHQPSHLHPELLAISPVRDLYCIEKINEFP